MPFIDAVWSRIDSILVGSDKVFHPFEVEFAKISIDFRHFRFEFGAIALG